MAISEGPQSRRPGRHPDRRLALAVLENARTFEAMSQTLRGRAGGGCEDYLAIAMELGLKAYLLDRGISDHWNRIHIGHDLGKAFRSVRRSGLKGLPDGLEPLVRDLNPVGRAVNRHHDRPGLSAGVSDDLAQALVGELLARISAAMHTEQERSSGENRD